MLTGYVRKLLLEEYGNDQDTCRAQALQFRERREVLDDAPSRAATHHELCQFGGGHRKDDIGVRCLRLVAQCELHLVVIADLDGGDLNRRPDTAIVLQALLPGLDQHLLEASPQQPGEGQAAAAEHVLDEILVSGSRCVAA